MTGPDKRRELGKASTSGIIVHNRMRPLDEAKVKALAESIQAVGLQNPIHVWKASDNKVILVAGHHRLAAAIQLGRHEIDCFFVNLSDIYREIWQIDENLMRAGLTPAQEAEHMARRKELWGQRDLAIPAALDRRPIGIPTGGANCTTSLNDGRPAGPQHQKGFASAVAENTGMDKSNVNRAIARGAAIAPDIIQDIQGTAMDKGVELDALKGFTHDEQRQVVQRVKEGHSENIRAAASFIKGDDVDGDDVDNKRVAKETEKQLNALKRAWQKANDDARQMFNDWLVKAAS